MGQTGKRFGDELKSKVKKAIDESGANIASAINIDSNNQRTFVSSRQRVVHRDGVTTTVTERREGVSDDSSSHARAEQDLDIDQSN